MNGLRLLQNRNPRQRRTAMTLTELLCVVAVLAILATLYLTAVARAFVRIKQCLDKF
jgi:prepilin-type N-terminal cleavage/methylation domain-containing protein